MHVQHLCARAVAQDAVTYSVHQVCLTKTNTTVDKERVVDATGIVANLHTCCAGELIGFADADGSTPPDAFQDLVVSGINRGENDGLGAWTSGTVAAAIEGACGP